MRNRPRNADQYKPQTLRPIFEENDLAQAIWIELVPHMVKMVIVEPGVGPTPKVGDFIRVKQFVYLLQKMVNIRQEHITYTFGRKKLIKGLQYCLSLCRQGFKGRLYIESSFAYGKQQLPQIPANSSLVIDIDINSISSEPITAGQHDDQELIAEIIAKAKDGDSYARSGDYIEAQKYYQASFSSIQSGRCKQIKSYLYSKSKTAFVMNNAKKTQEQINKEIAQVVQMYKIFDIIKIKTVELAVINKDYYKVIFLTKQCLLESRLQSNQRLLSPRATAFAQIGEFHQAMAIMKHLHDLYPSNRVYQEQLKRIEEKEEKYSRNVGQLQGQPVLALTQPNKRRRKKRDKVEVQYEDEADNEEVKIGIQEEGLHIKYKDLDYFQ